MDTRARRSVYYECGLDRSRPLMLNNFASGFPVSWVVGRGEMFSDVHVFWRAACEVAILFVSANKQLSL
jgi:hypothetical protein